MSELSIAFVGLGNMGRPMAVNLHAAGFPLVVRMADAAGGTTPLGTNSDRMITPNGTNRNESADTGG
jgi:3-hydroxyisobutyrate dehydrogenase-like beta-hydroxyacid dehydrogenase